MPRPARTGSLALCLALGFAAAAGAMQAETTDVSGEWSLMAMEGEATMMAMELAFTQDGAELSGTLHGPMGATPLTGEVAGSEIKFAITVETPSGDTFEMVFTGTIEDNKKISGRMVAGSGEFAADFSAERKQRP